MAAVQPARFTPHPTDIPFLLAPEDTALFGERARRLESLAAGNAMGDYLRFAAEIAKAQQQALDSFPETVPPRVAAGLPPFAAGAFTPDPAWHDALRRIADRASAKAPADFASRLRDSLARATPADLDRWAQACISGDSGHLDLGLMPIVGAALQVYWAALLRDHDCRPAVARGQHAANLCPMCGSLPVGGIVRAGAATQGLRYLVCSLCASQWNMERIRCVSCGESKNIAYYNLEGSDGAVRAEACDACHGYTKIMHIEKNPGMEIVADDLATLALDVLMDEAGYQRYGLNPLLLTES